MSRTDPIERAVAAGLDSAGIKHEPGDDLGLDFYLPEYGFYIECKAFFTPRITDQMQRTPSLIVIQGLHAAEQFAAMLSHAALKARSEA